MARCDMCERKMPVLGGSYPYLGHTICEDCNKEVRIISDKYKWDEYTNEQIDDSLSYLKERIEEEKGESDLLEKIEELVNQELFGYDSFVELQNEASSFFAGRKSTNLGNHFVINESNKMFAVMEYDRYHPAHKFSELRQYEIIRNGQTISHSNASTVVMSANSSDKRNKKEEKVQNFDIILTFDTFDEKTDTIKLLNKRGYPYYGEDMDTIVKICNQIEKALKFILENKIEVQVQPEPVKSEPEKVSKNSSESEERPVFSVADEILKFKSLLDLDIITKEEFEEQKKKLLAYKY